MQDIETKLLKYITGEEDLKHLSEREKIIINRCIQFFTEIEEDKYKPSDFSGKYPWDSVFQSSEAETIASNIMIILKRTGNRFRSLFWDEYKFERLKDENFSDNEKSLFDQVIPYCISSDKAQLFSKNWKK